MVRAAASVRSKVPPRMQYGSHAIFALGGLFSMTRFTIFLDRGHVFLRTSSVKLLHTLFHLHGFR